VLSQKAGGRKALPESQKRKRKLESRQLGANNISPSLEGGGRINHL